MFTAVDRITIVESSMYEAGVKWTQSYKWIDLIHQKMIFSIELSCQNVLIAAQFMVLWKPRSTPWLHASVVQAFNKTAVQGKLSGIMGQKSTVFSFQNT